VTGTLAVGVSVDELGRILVQFHGTDDLVQQVDITSAVQEIARNVYAVAQATGMAPDGAPLESWSVH
jgi:hypothetical protein